MAPIHRWHRRPAGFLMCVALVAAASALAAPPPSSAPAATRPTSAGPGLPQAAFSSIGPGLAASHAPSPDPADKDDVEADQTAVKLLARQIPVVRLKGLGLQDAFGYIRDLTDLTIYVNWDALADLGIKSDDTVTIGLKTVTIGNILDVILADAQNGRQVVDYQIDHGALRIDTVKNLNKTLVARSYDVTAVVTAMVKVGAVSDATSPDESQERDVLVRQVIAHISPSLWMDAGDKISTTVDNPNPGAATNGPQTATAGPVAEKITLTVNGGLLAQRAVAEYLDKRKDSDPRP